MRTEETALRVFQQHHHTITRSQGPTSRKLGQIHHFQGNRIGQNKQKAQNYVENRPRSVPSRDHSGLLSTSPGGPLSPLPTREQRSRSPLWLRDSKSTWAQADLSPPLLRPRKQPQHRLSVGPWEWHSAFFFSFFKFN